MKKIAFITSEVDPHLIPDDQLAIEPLRKQGFSVSPLVWDSESQDLEAYDAFVFRSCWNYHVKFERFLKWLDVLERTAKPIFNPLAIGRWNLNKSYLLELAAKGAPVPRTEWVAKGKAFDPAGFESPQIVIRPAVSLDGHDTYLVPTTDRARIQEIWRSMPADRDIIVQEFIPEIYSRGETSLMFFNGEFSHGLKKIPGGNEFRIHERWGGSRSGFQPDSQLIDQAKDVLKLVVEPLLFARVDFIERASGPLLIELEIIDPMLFLGYSDGAPERFARAIAQCLG